MPTGTVTVTDNLDYTCTGTVSEGQCILRFWINGTENLIAIYSGDGAFAGSISEPEAHTILPANTTTTIVSDAPA